MSNLKIFSEDLKVSNKRIIVRLDLNVPINNFKIEDNTRIKIIEPFINKLIEKKAKIIIISHLGRPRGKIVKEMSLKPIYDYLRKNLLGNISFYQGEINNDAVNASKNLIPGEVLLIENIRFFKEEENDDENFAKNLSKLDSHLDIFLMSGHEDVVGNFGNGPKRILKLLHQNNINAKLKLFKSMRHEILNEIDNHEGGVLGFWGMIKDKSQNYLTIR